MASSGERLGLPQPALFSPYLVDVFAGAFGGSCGVLVGSPLDNAAVRLQQAGCKHTSTWACLRGIVRSEGGARALFKGMSYPLVTISLQSSIVFQAFGLASRYLEASAANAPHTPTHAPATTSLLGSPMHAPPGESSNCNATPQSADVASASEHLHASNARDVPADCMQSLYGESRGTGVDGPCETSTSAARGQVSGVAAVDWEALSRVYVAGTFAGCIQTIITVPQELLKIRTQLQPSPLGSAGYKSPFKMMWSIVGREGVLGLYRGMGITLVRDVPSYGVYFAVNQLAKDLLQPEARVSQQYSGWTELAAGGAAGSIAWASIYPVELLKSRVQATGRPWREVLRSLLAQEGLRALTRGMPAVLMKAFVTNAAIFYGYGTASQYLERL